MSASDDVRRVFGRFSASGIFFQGGAAAIDTGTIVATLVHGLTGGSAIGVGAAATIARARWLLPQLIVGYIAQRRERRMPFYVTGAFGRALPSRAGWSLVARSGVVRAGGRCGVLRRVDRLFIPNPAANRLPLRAESAER